MNIIKECNSLKQKKHDKILKDKLYKYCKRNLENEEYEGFFLKNILIFFKTLSGV
jgi:hypothetical protein